MRSMPCSQRKRTGRQREQPEPTDPMIRRAVLVASIVGACRTSARDTASLPPAPAPPSTSATAASSAPAETPFDGGTSGGAYVVTALAVGPTQVDLTVDVDKARLESARRPDHAEFEQLV